MKSINMITIYNLLKSSLYLVFIYLGIKTGVVKALFVLMLIDSFLGIVKALRLGHKFSFKKLAWGMVAKLTILIIPMVIALMAKGLNLDFNYFVVIVMDILIVSEGISCITNILSIKTKKQIENTDYITKMLEAIRRGFMGLIQKLIGSLEDININNKKDKQS